MAHPRRRVVRKLDSYTIVFLMRSPDAPDLPAAELDALQERHLAFLQRMRDEGHSLVSGPVTGQPDPALRGITIYRTNLEETRRLAQQDPSVQAGRLAAEVFTWLIPSGLLGDRPASTIESD